ncbi:MAG: V-type ATP synthase subunit D [Eubacteriaceae bacterium]|nr:V-type ATP synthase subunit D [Eubacteriaceae bacterium]MDD4508788.1 V-type ATP synthase subunit D [Eubacteriaceae bacterium]
MAIRVNPTRMELTRLKKRLKTASRGHKLLKDKRDEMVRRFMGFIRRNKELREEIDEKLTMAMGRFSLAEAQMGADAVLEALLCPARDAKITIGKQNIMNIDVPTLHYEEEGQKTDLPYGFAFSSGELDQAVLDVAELMPLLIELAQVEKTCNMLADEIEKTRRRVNALEHVMIPEMIESIKYITMKLEDNERGNITRLMKVKEMMVDN